MVDIPVMGNDGNAYSKDYIISGEIPRFMHLNEYNGEITDLYSNNIPEWENNTIFMVGTLEKRNVLPEKILLNAYPNPFNPSTTLSVSMPVDGMIQVSIYNLSGQEIKEIVHEFNTAGTYKYTWNAALYPSGVYFAQISLNNTVHTQKLILMK